MDAATFFSAVGALGTVVAAIIAYLAYRTQHQSTRSHLPQLNPIPAPVVEAAVVQISSALPEQQEALDTRPTDEPGKVRKGTDPLTGLQIGGDPKRIFDILVNSPEPLTLEEWEAQMEGLTPPIPPVAGKKGKDRILYEMNYYRTQRKDHPLLKLLEEIDGKWRIKGSKEDRKGTEKRTRLD